MIEEVRDYNIVTNARDFTVRLAHRIAPGLLVYRIPEGMHQDSPHRWRIGHESSGRSVADAMNREDAIAGAEMLAPMTDWMLGLEDLRASLSADELYVRISGVGMGCIPPASEPMPGNVAHNGTYTEADIEQYAAECKAEELDALQITCAMSATVPWMGLDTNDFNEAHGRICVLADAA
ncbi:hypothetical protein [Streptomyces vinaceus]|uniref:hypothetical protein n=1 Tax=Streptomyces vinaceus TaxID=1960 RepID=UPI003676C91F